MNRVVPKVIDYRLTSSCNMRCPFCFGPVADTTLDEKALRVFFSFFKELGLRYVVLTGGEPTSAPHFECVVRLLKELGLKLALSTNGTFWLDQELREFVIGHFNWIALPVDSPSAEKHNALRRCAFNHHKLIYSILAQIRNDAPSVKIKIGTVVTMENISTVPALLDGLPIMPDVWKLYQLSKSGINKEYYIRQRVADDAFGELIFHLKNQYRGRVTKIHTSYEKERNGQYLFLEPDGKVMTIKSGTEYVLGDYTNCGKALVKEIEENVDSDSVISNFRNSFG